jgi:hypothetical protein
MFGEDLPHLAQSIESGSRPEIAKILGPRSGRAAPRATDAGVDPDKDLAIVLDIDFRVRYCCPAR